MGARARVYAVRGFSPERRLPDEGRSYAHRTRGRGGHVRHLWL